MMINNPDGVPATLLLFSLLVSLGVAARPTIKPKTPVVVRQGGVFRFTADRPVSWSLAPGGQGSIDADGTYHAPAHVEVKQSLAGCQILPNDHIFNTRIDKLPVHVKSDFWMNTPAANGQRATAGTVNYLPPDMPANLITSAVPAEKMVFAYTPFNNGLFRIPPSPDFKVQSGLYTPPFANFDRHSLTIETDTCIFQEMYNLYPAGTNTYNQCPKCTSQSGVRYGNLSYALPFGATDAAAMYLAPLSIHRDEILSGRINHALRVTLLGAFIHNTHIWPAMAEAGYNSQDRIPFGARIRLKSSFVSASKNPYTQALIRQLKEYGLIVADIGLQWSVSSADVDLYFDPEIINAFREIASSVGGSSLEIVDESKLMINPGSGQTNVDAEIVIATDKRDGKSATARVVLTGVNLGSDTQYVVFQAGAPAHQLKAWVNGTEDKTVLWSMSPSIGTLSSAGVYTPPSNLSRPQTFTVTAKARAEPSPATTIPMTLLPGGTIRIDNGNTSSHTDSKGNLWLPTCCTSYPTIYSYDGYPWPKIPDINLYINDSVAWSDIPFAIYMKPGNYRITAKMAEPTNSSPGVRVMHLDSQGQLVYRDVDLFALAGVRHPIDFDLPAVVGPDGKLEFWVRHVLGEQALLSALQITADAGTPRIQVSPSNGGTLSLSDTKRFYAVRWFLPNGPMQWSISPKIGSIDGNGLYTAPSSPLAQDTVVTVTARSANDPKLTASSTLTVRKGIPTIRVNCGGSQFTDAHGNFWSGDFGFQGGSAIRRGYTDQGCLT